MTEKTNPKIPSIIGMKWNRMPSQLGCSGEVSIPEVARHIFQGGKSLGSIGHQPSPLEV